VTLLAYGAMMMPSLEAADRLAKEGVEVEVIDLRTLLPYDKEAIFRSLDKTSRVLVVHEDVKTLGIGAELSAVIMEREVRRARRAGDARHVSRHALPLLAHPRGANLPNADKIADAIRKLAEY